MRLASLPLIVTASLLIAAAVAPAARAATPFVVTLDDFSRKTLHVDALDGRSLKGSEGEQAAAVTIPAPRLLTLERAATPTATQAADAFVLLRRDGQRLVGRPGVIEKDALQFTTASTGEWRVPLTEVALIARANGREPSLPATPLPHDELRLANGDAVVGIVSESTPERVTCQSSDGQAVPVEWSNVRQLRFAQAGGESKAASPAYRLSLADGTRIGVADLQIAGGRAKARDGERVIDVAIDDVRRVESLAGSTRLLANLTPTESTRSAYFPKFDATFGSERTTTVAPANAATSAIAARPRSTTTWATQGAATFHARYVIPAGLPRADVTIRVRADDRVAFERQHVRSGDDNPPIDVPLEGAKSLTLEVDFGDNYDVQDEFYWLDAALIGTPSSK